MAALAAAGLVPAPAPARPAPLGAAQDDASLSDDELMVGVRGAGRGWEATSVAAHHQPPPGLGLAAPAAPRAARPAANVDATALACARSRVGPLLRALMVEHERRGVKCVPHVAHWGVRAGGGAAARSITRPWPVPAGRVGWAASPPPTPSPQPLTPHQGTILPRTLPPPAGGGGCGAAAGTRVKGLLQRRAHAAVPRVRDVPLLPPKNGRP